MLAHAASRTSPTIPIISLSGNDKSLTLSASPPLPSISRIVFVAGGRPADASAAGADATMASAACARSRETPGLKRPMRSSQLAFGLASRLRGRCGSMMRACIMVGT